MIFQFKPIPIHFFLLNLAGVGMLHPHVDRFGRTLPPRMKSDNQAASRSHIALLSNSLGG